MKDTLDLQKFYPEEIDITEVTQNEKEIYIHVSVQSKNCTCPKCGVLSEHKHGTYKRKLQDLPILGRTTYLIVNAYEYQCDNSSCDVTTFVENVNRDWGGSFIFCAYGGPDRGDYPGADYGRLCLFNHPF